MLGSVLVVGAGPAGATLAALLARRGVAVTLVRSPGGRHPLLGEVLPPPVRAQLKRIGLGDVLEHPAHRSVPGTVSAWGGDRPVLVDHLLSPYGDGLHLDRRVFDDGLVERASQEGARVVAAPRSAWRDLMSGTRSLKVAVDATGRAATLARADGASADRHDRLVAVVGILPSDARPADEEHRVLLAATRDGWWVSVLLTDGRRVGAFHTDHDLLDQRLRSDPSAWLDALLAAPVIGPLIGSTARRPPDRLAVVAGDSRRLRWPPSREPGSDQPSERATILAVGDAEMAFDPLSSGGIGAAVASAGEVVPVIEVLVGATGPGEVEAALDARAAAAEERWRAYRARLREAYRAEPRWRHAPFWSRRNRD